MDVTIISLTERSDDCVAVTFLLSQGEHEDFETFLVSRARSFQLKLSVGATSTDIYDEVSYYGKLYEACKQAMNFLAYGDNSRKKLIAKLRGKGIEPEIAEEAAAELEGKGYINDIANAAREAERCVRKLWGRRRISAALYEKGYGEEASRKAIFALEDAGVDFTENCAELIRKRYGDLPTDPQEKAKLFASMTRYGYSASEINSAIDKIKEEQ